MFHEYSNYSLEVGKVKNIFFHFMGVCYVARNRRCLCITKFPSCTIQNTIPIMEKGPSHVPPCTSEKKDVECLPGIKQLKCRLHFETSQNVLFETHKATNSSQNSYTIESLSECFSRETERYLPEIQPARSTERADENADTFCKVSAVERAT